jgi:DNA-binding transcriptional LysR family regulator
VNLRQLETFVAVAEESGFSRAADRLHVVQSAVSATVRGLEQELDAELFRRLARGAELTDAGRALLPEARATLAAAAAARDAVDAVRGGLRGTVALGIMQAMRTPAPNPPAILAAFRRDHPGVTVRVRHGGGSRDMAAQVADGRLDLALVSLREPVAGIALETLTRQPVGLICPLGHPLARRSSLRLADIADEPFVELPPAWGTRINNDHAFAAAGLAREVAYEINDTASLVEFVRHGLGVALFPRSLVGPVTDLAWIAMDEEAGGFEVSLAHPTTRRPSASAGALRAAIVAHASARRARATEARPSTIG